MKAYKVTVNGTAYEITLEAIDAADVKAAPAVAAAPVSAPAAAPAGGETVNAPMPGNVLDIKVANGATVKKGQPILVLEAMKMDNDIVAPCDGVVTFQTSKGANVESDAVLAVIA